MEVQVRLHGASLAGLAGGESRQWQVGRRVVTLPEGATAGDLIRLLRIDEGLVCMMSVNGRAAEAATVLTDGNLVDLIPPITGGRG